MIERDLEPRLISALQQVPVVAVVGPRQVGKTTLARQMGENQLGKTTAYLDLELSSDLSKLDDAEAYLRRFEHQLLVIDEVQRMPDLFRILRGLIDIRRRAGEKTGQFLLLGSASRELLQHSSENLAGRIRYLEMSPFSVGELYRNDPLGFNLERLWFRGGFPNSYMADTDDESWEWRNDFISTYVERDIPLWGTQVSATRMKRFWTMLAHYHGQQVNMADLGRSLDVSHTTIKSYLDILTDFYMVRPIQPWSGNTKKRLVKSPKIFLRDTGLLHKLLNISQFEDLLGNPIIGASWEGFVIENIINRLSSKWQYSYYRTTNQTEIDLVLEGPHRQVWAVEVKRSSAPSLKKGFHDGAEDIKATRKIVIYAGTEQFPMADKTEAMGLTTFLKLLEEQNNPPGQSQ